MKTLVWISAGLMLIGLLSFSSISLAEEGKWTKKADMPTARYELSTSVVNGKIYAIGGENGESRHLSTVEEYNPTTNKWTKKADMPTGRRFSSPSVVNGKIYVIGGISFNRLVPTVEEYDPKTDKWSKKADMPTARWGLSTSAVNGKIYAIGGANAANGPLLTVEAAKAVESKEKLATAWGKIKAIGK